MTPATHRLGGVLAGLALSVFALSASAGIADAARTTPTPRPPNPCIHVVGTPDPCAPPTPEPPGPVDPECLRVDVDPLHCPYQP